MFGGSSGGGPPPPPPPPPPLPPLPPSSSSSSSFSSSASNFSPSAFPRNGGAPPHLAPSSAHAPFSNVGHAGSFPPPPPPPPHGHPHPNLHPHAHAHAHAPAPAPAPAPGPFGGSGSSYAPPLPPSYSSSSSSSSSSALLLGTGPPLPPSSSYSTTTPIASGAPRSLYPSSWSFEEIAANTLLKSCPTDGISRVRFAPNSDHLVVSSWDATLRVYEARANKFVKLFNMDGALLDCDFGYDEHTVFATGLDMQIYKCSVEDGSMSVMGSHEKPVRCIEFLKQPGLVATASWDQTLQLNDPRMSNSQVASITLPDRAFAMSHYGNRIVVGTAGRFIEVFDVRSLPEPEQKRESSLKYQTRCISCFPDGEGFAVGSIEGRVAVEWFNPSESVQAKKFAFKCHRMKSGGVDHVYPVNTIAFHPLFGTFATGGCDKRVTTWDPKAKKKLADLEYSNSIASMSFNQDGSLIAIASSYTFEEGEKQHDGDKIFIRSLTEKEIAPKLD